MEKHYRLSDQEFERRFENCQLDPADFSHEAHLRLAWIHLTKYGREQAQENIQLQLQNFVSHAGAKDKYNATVTLGAIKAVYHFKSKSTTACFQDFIAAFPQLKNNFKGLMKLHYSFDIFNSQKAKKHFLEPDICPFD